MEIARPHGDALRAALAKGAVTVTLRPGERLQRARARACSVLSSPHSTPAFARPAISLEHVPPFDY